MGRKLNVKNVEDFSKGYWSDIKSLHDEYVKSDKSKYPITMLRHALNTPEVTAWVRGDKNKYTDPKLREAIVELIKNSIHSIKWIT